jgi:3-oxoacyl-[acyl-carrier-protein] synthase-1
MPTVAEIVSVGIECPVGLAAASATAAVRAGIARLAESHVFDKHGEPLVMGLVQDEYLSPLADGLAGKGLPPWRSRLVRLATRPLQEALRPAGDFAAIPLVLSVPEAVDNDRTLIDLIAAQTGASLDPARSLVIPQGRAAGLAALGHALQMLEMHEARMVLVGGVDSYLESTRLRILDDEGRLKTGPVSDGFIPGEGAAFLLVCAEGGCARAGSEPVARILGLGCAHEAGHMYSSEPCRGDGLASALHHLFGGCAAPPVRCVYGTFNGESFWAKEWGAAFMRSRAHFADPLRFEHPADCIGDAGAGLGSILLALAAMGLERGHVEGPCLVFGSSDRGLRGAVLLAACKSQSGAGASPLL